MSLVKARYVTAEDRYWEFIHSVMLMDSSDKNLIVNYVISTLPPYKGNRFIVDIYAKDMLKCYYVKGNKKQSTSETTPTF